jgi:RNA polymerase sigma-70 factor (ECF subfamily)
MRRSVSGAPLPDRADAPPEEDAILMRRLAGGDLGALGELYDRHWEDVHRFVVYATQDATDAEDLAQNVFLTAARVAERYDGRASCRPWLIGIAVRLVERRWQRQGRVARYLARWASSVNRVPDPGPALEARSTLDRVAVALAQMTPTKRVVILMAEVEGLTCDEIARALAIPLGTVWTRLFAARKELRAAVPEWREL